jgi:hypothetical protein
LVIGCKRCRDARDPTKTLINAATLQNHTTELKPRLRAQHSLKDFSTPSEYPLTVSSGELFP